MRPSLSPRLRSVVHSLSAKFSIVVLNAATGILTARTLHPAGRGELAAVLLWPMLLSGSLTLGLPSALTFQIRRAPERTRALLTTAFAMALVIGVAGTALAIALAPVLLRQYSPAIVFIARCLMPNLIIGILLLVGRAALESADNFARSGVVLVVPPLLTIAGLLGLALTHHLTPATAGISYTVAGLPAFFLLLHSLPVSFRLRSKQFVASARTLLSYGLRSYGVDLCGTVAFYIDQAVVVGLLSPAAMGSYVVSLSFSRVMSVPHQALAGVLFPSMVDLPRERMRVVTERGLRLGGTLALLTTGFVLVAGKPLLGALYGHAFAQDALILPMLTLEAGLSGCVLIVAQAFMACDRPGTMTLQQLLGLGASLLLLFVLVPRMGVRGAALSILLSTTLRFLFISLSFAREFNGGLPALLLNRESVQWLRARLDGPRSALPAEAAVALPGGPQ